MNPKVSYTLVGLFVLVLMAGLVTSVVWISSSATAKTYQTYVAFMYESVSGLNVNAPVTYRGVEVGYVQEIALDENRPDRVRLMLAIESVTPVKEDTVAVLVMQGITGLAKLELTGGSIESPRLVARPGARYPEVLTGPSFFVRIDQAITTLAGSLESTIQQLNIVAERVADLLDAENRGYIAGTLQNIEVITGSIANSSDAIQSGINQVNVLLRNVARASEQLPGLLDEAENGIGAFANTAQNADTTLAAIGETATTITTAVAELDNLMAGLGEDLDALMQNTPAQVDQLMTELTRLSQDLRRLTVDLESAPNMLIFGRPDTPLGPGEED